jgi:dihydroflavonol-4-reductase
MTTLVTGGAGFIGGELARRLLARGEEVRVLDVKAHEARDLAGSGAELLEGDVLSPRAVREALEGCDRLFHVAALFRMWERDRRRYEKINVEGTRNVLDAALDAQVSRVVYTSSAVTIGEADGQLGTENTAHRGYFLSDYERSKYMAERLALDISGRGLPLVVVNPTSVYGPGQTTNLTGALARFLNGRLPVVVDARLNFVFLDDVVEGHLSAMERGRVGRRYVLGGENASLVEFLSLGAEIAGLSRRPRTLPGLLVRGSARLLETVSRVSRRRPWVSVDEARTASHSFIFDTSRARVELGLEWTPLRTGLERTVGWLRQEGLVGDRQR